MRMIDIDKNREDFKKNVYLILKDDFSTSKVKFNKIMNVFDSMSTTDCEQYGNKIKEGLTMDRNEIIKEFINSEIKREVAEISYDILKEYSQATININHYFDTDNIIYLRGVKAGLDKALKIIEKRYNDEKN